KLLDCAADPAGMPPVDLRLARVVARGRVTPLEGDVEASAFAALGALPAIWRRDRYEVDYHLCVTGDQQQRHDTYRWLACRQSSDLDTPPLYIRREEFGQAFGNA